MSEASDRRALIEAFAAEHNPVDEGQSVRFKVWEARAWDSGDVVLKDGKLWLATADTEQTPSDAATDWAALGGGGSAFAHLSEDTDNEFVITDWGFHVGPADYAGRYGELFSGSLVVGQGVGATKGTVSLDSLAGVKIGTDAGVGTEGPAISVNHAGDADQTFQVLADGSLHWGDGTAAPDVHLQRANGFNGLLLVDPDFGGFNVSELDDFSTQSSQMTPDTVQTADAGANTFASLSATGQVVISAHSTVRHLTVDADGDLAIIGVGKVSTH